MNREKCQHPTFYKDREIIVPSGPLIEQYREIHACSHCGYEVYGPWKTRRVLRKPAVRRTAEKRAEMRNSLYGPEK